MPSELKATLVRLGEDVRRARIRRSLKISEVAERSFLTAPTLRKVERGDPSVSLGAVATVLWIMGLQGRLGEMLEQDQVGEELEARKRPRRVRRAVEDLF